MVAEGSKTQTVRLTARCKPGDVLSLREWTGRPYRSPQRILRTEICLSVDEVRFENVAGRGWSVWRAGLGLTADEREALAAADGFDSAEDMSEWFADEHGLPFEGVIILWAAT